MKNRRPLDFTPGNLSAANQFGLEEDADPQPYSADPQPEDRLAFRDRDVRRDSLAEELGESFLRTATSGDDRDPDFEEESSLEAEMGGPFVETTTEQEFAYDTDASNPSEATKEPFPTT